MFENWLFVNLPPGSGFSYFVVFCVAFWFGYEFASLAVERGFWHR